MDEVPSKHLPSRSIQPTPSTKRRPPRERRVVDLNVSCSQEPVATTVCDEATNTDNEYDTVMSALQERVEILEKELLQTKNDLLKQQFRLSNIADNDKKVSFYTGFPSYSALKACFEFLGPSVHQLSYNSKSDSSSGKKRRPHILPPFHI